MVKEEQEVHIQEELLEELQHLVVIMEVVKDTLLELLRVTVVEQEEQVETILALHLVAEAVEEWLLNILQDSQEYQLLLS
jgi:hypothetical protein